MDKRHLTRDNRCTRSRHTLPASEFAKASSPPSGDNVYRIIVMRHFRQTRIYGHSHEAIDI